jgi:predicted HTH domain antitoxin
MGSISARVPDDLEEELQTFIDEERLDTSTAIRKLLSEGLDEWRTERALERLERGEVTFSKAAELAGVDMWALARLARDRDIMWVGDDHLESDLDDL